MSVPLLLILLGFGALILYAMTKSSNSGTTSGNPVVDAIANAIANAEGYFNGAGSVPYDQNNPGDLTDTSIGGVTATGSGINGISIFGSVEDGWNALYAKIENILNGNSSVYSPSMSLSDLGQTWANDAGQWASNVAAALGISTDDSLADYAAANAPTDGGSEGQ